MAKKADKSLPGKTYMAAPLEDDLHKVASELAKRLKLNTTQFLRRAIVNLLEDNSIGIPDATQQELAKEGVYRRGRPPKPSSAPARPDEPRLAAKVRKPTGVGE